MVATSYTDIRPNLELLTWFIQNGTKFKRSQLVQKMVILLFNRCLLVYSKIPHLWHLQYRRPYPPLRVQPTRPSANVNVMQALFTALELPYNSSLVQISAGSFHLEYTVWGKGNKTSSVPLVPMSHFINRSRVLGWQPNLCSQSPTGSHVHLALLKLFASASWVALCILSIHIITCLDVEISPRTRYRLHSPLQTLFVLNLSILDNIWFWIITSGSTNLSDEDSHKLILNL